MSGCTTISVINWKGGVGKTTITHHLGTGLLHLGEEGWSKYLGKKDPPRVLLVDNDAQCNLSISCLGADDYEELVYNKKLGTVLDLYQDFFSKEGPDINVDDYILKWHVRRTKDKSYPTVHLLPAHQGLIFTDMHIAEYKRNNIGGDLIDTDGFKFQVLEKILAQVRDNYDYIFIDCPPNLNYITQNALFASDYYLMPTLLDVLSSYGLKSITDKLNQLNQKFIGVVPDYHPIRLLGIVMNNVQEYAKEPKGSQFYILERLYQTFGEKVFSNYIVNGDGISAATQIGVPVYALSSRGGVAKKQAEALMAIVSELMERIQEDKDEGK